MGTRSRTAARDDELPHPASSTTLVHELTHALHEIDDPRRMAELVLENATTNLGATAAMVVGKASSGFDVLGAVNFPATVLERVRELDLGRRGMLKEGLQSGSRSG